jgi:hypothetical protein
MKYGFDNDLFYVDFVSCSRQPGNIKEESERFARDIANRTSKILVCNSGGVDSQCAIHSFKTQGIDIETAFLHLPGYNDNEFNQVKLVDEKYKIKTKIVEIDPLSAESEIVKQTEQLDVSNRNALLHRKFIDQLPEDYLIIQHIHDPLVYVNPNSGNKWYCQGYNSAEISRARAFESLSREVVFFGNTPEYLVSVIGDDVFKAAIVTAKYFDENGAKINGKNLKVTDRYDYYIKPLLYGRYWGDELIYFPKFSGFENIPYINDHMDAERIHALTIPYFEFLDFLNTKGSITKRVYENVNVNYKPPGFKK